MMSDLSQPIVDTVLYFKDSLLNRLQMPLGNALRKQDWKQVWMQNYYNIGTAKEFHKPSRKLAQYFKNQTCTRLREDIHKTWKSIKGDCNKTCKTLSQEKWFKELLKFISRIGFHFWRSSSSTFGSFHFHRNKHPKHYE